jgi:hypothetical protein
MDRQVPGLDERQWMVEKMTVVVRPKQDKVKQTGVRILA